MCIRVIVLVASRKRITMKKLIYIVAVNMAVPVIMILLIIVVLRIALG